MSFLRFAHYPTDGEQFTEEAAASLVGKRTVVRSDVVTPEGVTSRRTPVVVTDATLTPEGAILITLRVDPTERPPHAR